MAEFEYRTPLIPQRNFKNISSKRCQILESGSLNYHNLNFQHMLIQEYNLKVTRKILSIILKSSMIEMIFI